MALNDFNRDGKSDILWENESNYQVGWSNMATGKMGAYNVLQSQNANPFGHADYNGDGYADLLISNTRLSGDPHYYSIQDGRTGSTSVRQCAGRNLR